MKMVISGSKGHHLAYKIAKKLSIDFVPCEVRLFPDGELYIRITKDPYNKSIIYLQSCYGDPSRDILEFIFTVRTLKELNSKEVIGIIPYLPYMRQDDRFKNYEVVSAKILFEIIRESGLDMLISIDIHLHRLADLTRIFGFPIVNLTAMEKLALASLEYFDDRDIIVVAPDSEAEQWAKLASDTLNTDYIVLQKVRHGDEEVTVSGELSGVEGRSILIVDDIISTGSTLVNTLKELRKFNVKRVIAACTHALLVRNAEEKLFNAGLDAIISTNTVLNPYMKVDVADIIAEYLSRHFTKN